MSPERSNEEVDILSILLNAHATIPGKPGCMHPDRDCKGLSTPPCNHYERCFCGDSAFPPNHCNTCVHQEDCHAR